MQVISGISLSSSLVQVISEIPQSPALVQVIGEIPQSPTLNRECQRQRIDGFIAHICNLCRVRDVRNEKGINNIVKRLPQHGDHHWRAHVEQQALDCLLYTSDAADD